MASPTMSYAAPLNSFRHLCPALSFPTTINFSPATTASAASANYPHPSLEVLGGARDALLPVLKTLAHPYQSSMFVGWNGHVETIFAAFFRSIPDVRYRRECLRMKDGGVVALDWHSGDRFLLALDSPVLLLLPGLAGGSGDHYVKHLLVRARARGWRVVVFNSRGCADSPVVTPKFYSAAYTEDLREVVAELAARYPKANLYAVGWSLGANILVRYLGQDSHNCPLSGAVSLCNPFNIVIADQEFSKGINFIYDKVLAVALRKIFNKHILLFQGLDGKYDIQLTANCESVREFHEGITVATFGYESVDDYYSNSNSSDLIKDVQTPLLCIQAANDPIAPYKGIPHEDIKENPNCLLVITPTGGHLGWVAGDEAPSGGPWTDPVVMDFLEHLESSSGLESSSSSNGIKLRRSALTLPDL